MTRQKLRRFIFNWWPFITLGGYCFGVLGFGLFISILLDLSESTARLASSVRVTNSYILNVKEQLDQTNSRVNINVAATQRLTARVNDLEKMLTVKGKFDAEKSGGMFLVREYVLIPKDKKHEK